MSQVILELPDRTERDLLRLSARSGKDVPAIIAELVEDALLTEEFNVVLWKDDTDAAREFTETAAGIQRGLDDRAAGRYRPFSEFAAEVRAKHLSQLDTP